MLTGKLCQARKFARRPQLQRNRLGHSGVVFKLDGKFRLFKHGIEALIRTIGIKFNPANPTIQPRGVQYIVRTPVRSAFAGNIIDNQVPGIGRIGLDKRTAENMLLTHIIKDGNLKCLAVIAPDRRIVEIRRNRQITGIGCTIRHPRNHRLAVSGGIRGQNKLTVGVDRSGVIRKRR